MQSRRLSLLILVGVVLASGGYAIKRLGRSGGRNPFHHQADGSNHVAGANPFSPIVPGGSQTGRGPTSSQASFEPNAPAKTRIAASYLKLPLSFERNVGQMSDEGVKFLSRGEGYSLGLTPTGAVLALQKAEPKREAAHPARPREKSPDKLLPLPDSALGAFANPPGAQLDARTLLAEKAEARASARVSTQVLRMELVGANEGAQAAALEELPGKSNYFIGNDPKKWRTGVPTYAKVKYQSVYPGVDLVYYGNQRQLEYDFVVAPGADAKAIRLKFDGAEKLSVDGATGDLVLKAGGGEVRFRKPTVYQPVAATSSLPKDAGGDTRATAADERRSSAASPQSPIANTSTAALSSRAGTKLPSDSHPTTAARKSSLIRSWAIPRSWRAFM